MAYCIVTKRNVYGCDHYNCKQGYKSVRGKKYCQVAKNDVYSCDHYQCNK